MFMWAVKEGYLTEGSLDIPHLGSLYWTIRYIYLNLNHFPEEKREYHVFLADDAFPLTENICKPYSTDLNIGSPKRVCNYRISRARRVVENTFGLLASVFRILHKTIDLHVENTKKVVLACVYLHNFLRRSSQSLNLYSPPGVFDNEDIDTGRIIPGSW